MTGNVDPAHQLVVRVIYEAEDWHRGITPVVGMLVDWDGIVAFGCAVRDPGLHLESDAEKRDRSIVPDVHVGVFSEVILLRDLLKHASMAFKERLSGIDTFTGCNALWGDFSRLGNDSVPLPSESIYSIHVSNNKLQ